MTEKFHVIQSNIALKRVYICFKCGLELPGAVEHYTFTKSDPEGIKQGIINAPKKSGNMPIGWAYFGNFYCSECKHK